MESEQEAGLTGPAADVNFGVETVEPAVDAVRRRQLSELLRRTPIAQITTSGATA